MCLSCPGLPTAEQDNHPFTQQQQKPPLAAAKHHFGKGCSNPKHQQGLWGAGKVYFNGPAQGLPAVLGLAQIPSSVSLFCKGRMLWVWVLCFKALVIEKTGRWTQNLTASVKKFNVSQVATWGFLPQMNPWVFLLMSPRTELAAAGNEHPELLIVEDAENVLNSDKKMLRGGRASLICHGKLFWRWRMQSSYGMGWEGMGMGGEGIFAPCDFFTFSLAVSDLDMFMPFGNQHFGMDMRTQIRRADISEPVPIPSWFFYPSRRSWSYWQFTENYFSQWEGAWVQLQLSRAPSLCLGAGNVAALGSLPTRMEKNHAVGTCGRENNQGSWQERVYSVSSVECGCEMSVTHSLGFVHAGAAPWLSWTSTKGG